MQTSIMISTQARGWRATRHAPPSRSVSMAMAMMQIGVVGMPVHQPDMLMPMRMWFVRRIAWGVLVLVMYIVEMPVLMFHRFVDVVVLMLFGQV